MKLMHKGDIFNPKKFYISYFYQKYINSKLNVFTVYVNEKFNAYNLMQIKSIRVIGIDHTLNRLYPYNTYGGTTIHILDSEVFELTEDEVYSIIAELI
jgi:hypothetical protein